MGSTAWALRRIRFPELLASSVAMTIACHGLPPSPQRELPIPVTGSELTRIGRAVLEYSKRHDGFSGIIPLKSGQDAFATRVHLSASAERTIDAQYYIWHGDTSGTLLFEALRRAADRGVRVRILIDDNSTSGLDPILSSMNGHANIQVRLFNPFPWRHWRLLNYAFDFSRLNRRMHNKSFIVDGQVAIFGGRNIGDEYFGAGASTFVDLDVLAIGPVTPEASHDFDRYWSSELSIALDHILPTSVSGSDHKHPSAQAGRTPADGEMFSRVLARSPIVPDFLKGHSDFLWARATLVSDDPQKVLGHATDESLLITGFSRFLSSARAEVHLVSPYFVPTTAGVGTLAALSAKGIGVTVLTNSLSATDVQAVHAGYAGRRKPLLQAGIRILEMKRDTAAPDIVGTGVVGHSTSSLHAKTFAIDRRRAYVGSFNIDPRSARLNTENGLVIESAELAEAIADSMESSFPGRAYEVKLTAEGHLEWQDFQGGRHIVLTHEPETSFAERLCVFLLALLPLERLL